MARRAWKKRHGWANRYVKPDQGPEPFPCPACRRVVAYRTQAQKHSGGGKHRVRHKCPHGEWCVAGSRYANQGWNWPDCPPCHDAISDERGEHRTDHSKRIRHFGNYGLTGRDR